MNAGKTQFWIVPSSGGVTIAPGVGGGSPSAPGRDDHDDHAEEVTGTPRRRRGLGAIALAVGLVALALTAFVGPAGAHTPHDDVSDVAFSPDFAKDGQVFTVAASRLFVSDPGAYHWKPLVRGLPRAPEEEQDASTGWPSRRRRPRRCTSRRASVGCSDPTTPVDRGARPSTGIARPDLQALAVSPKDPDLVFAGADRSSASTGRADGGAHWDDGARLHARARGDLRPRDRPGRWPATRPGGCASRTTTARPGRTASAGSGAAVTAVAASTRCRHGHGVRRRRQGPDRCAPTTAARRSPRWGRGLPVDGVAAIALSPDFGERPHRSGSR